MTRPRYFWSRPQNPESAKTIYRVYDRELDMPIAYSPFREAAALIVLALNQSLKQEITNESTAPSTHSAAVPAITGRTACLGDFISGLQWSYPRSGLGLAEPPPRR